MLEKLGYVLHVLVTSMTPLSNERLSFLSYERRNSYFLNKYIF